MQEDTTQYNRALNKNLSNGSGGKPSESIAEVPGKSCVGDESIVKIFAENASGGENYVEAPGNGLAESPDEGLASRLAVSALFVSGSPVGVSAPLLKELAAQVDFILAVDGGAEQLVAADLVPDLLIGDFDSISQDTLARLKAEGVPMQSYNPYKNATDVELGVETLSTLGYKRLIATNVLGGRTDHALGSLGALAKAAHTCDMEVVVHDEHETCYFLSAGATTRVLELDFENSSELSSAAPQCSRSGAPIRSHQGAQNRSDWCAQGRSDWGEPIRSHQGAQSSARNLEQPPLLYPQHVSLIAWGGSVTVSLTGTEWELDHYELSPYSALGVSNFLRSAQLRLEVYEGSGTVLLLLSYAGIRLCV